MGWRTVRPLAHAAFSLLMAMGIGLMCLASLSYVELGSVHPFVLEKLPLQRPDLFLAALYVHVPAALVALPACLWLQWRGARRRWPRLHRWLGRATGVLVLAAVVPSGAYLALFAQGGWITTAGFWLTGFIAFAAMLGSIRAARRGDVHRHRRYSLHVTAQLSVAVVSRILLVGVETAHLYDEWAYAGALWIPVVGCALVAERVARPRTPALSAKGARHEEIIATARLDAVR